ncbi:serine-rich adhesin for platelets [Anastrepha obliqua]|uniref:serine-rich adhesin for platelets n=1 Tax=Anastrepha obliqua TaxID=95512 RepID=UPI002409EACC|nr:serine-rich adhesin for platelets [Anastrepha obliqua]
MAQAAKEPQKQPNTKSESRHNKPFPGLAGLTENAWLGVRQPADSSFVAVEVTFRTTQSHFEKKNPPSLHFIYISLHVLIRPPKLAHKPTITINICNANINSIAAHFYNILPASSVGGRSPTLVRLTRELSVKLLSEEPAAKEIASTAESLPGTLDQPQDQCLLDGVLMPKASVTCETQVGCRAIQKTGYCCPDYKCDCQKDGKTYSNGDKLLDPETPCTVCYCQGGEILCSSVTCFYRDDCKPKYIPGRCCPEYDNCPVFTFDPTQNAKKSNNPPTPAAEVNSAETTSAPPPAPPVLNPNITIKEITKPVEIRITDDNKVIPIHHMLKPQTTTTTTSTTATSTEQFTTTRTTTIADGSSSTLPPSSPSVAALSQTTPTEQEQNHSGESVSSSTTNNGNKTTFSIDNNRQTLLPVAGGVNNVESLKLSASVAYPSTERNTVVVAIPQNGANVENGSCDSGEVSAEVAQLVEDGEAIPAFGAQELQHDASLNDPTKVNIKRENLVTTERVTAGEELGSPELIDGNDGGQSGGLQLQNTFDLEPETSGSDNIYHIILTTAGPRVEGNTDGFAGFKATEDLPQSGAVDIQAAASNNQHTVVLPPLQLSNATATPINNDSTTHLPTTASTEAMPASSSSSSTDAPTLASTTPEAAKHSTDVRTFHLEEEDSAIPMEANPAYPSLPEDDFSLRDVNFPLSETDDAGETDIKDEQRSISSAFDLVRSYKPADEGSGSGINIADGSSTASYYGVSSDSTTETASKLPTKVALLMNSAEDLSSETAISNSSDFQLDRFSRLANNASNNSAESKETQLASETGSGSGESLEAEQKLGKQREPTTPRPKPHAAVDVDIDELGGNTSGDGNNNPEDDPKLDAESIKADENLEDGIVKQEAGQKEDVLTVNAKPTEERAAEEVPAATIGRIQRLFLQRFV